MRFNLTGDQISHRDPASHTVDQNQIQHFTARFNQLRVGQGELLTQVRRVNPALADQMAEATDAATAMTLFGRALQQTSNIFERNALARAGTGRGGLRTAAMFTGIDVASLGQSFEAAGRGLDDGLIKRLSQLEIESTKAAAKAKETTAAATPEPVARGGRQAADFVGANPVPVAIGVVSGVVSGVVLWQVLRKRGRR